MSTNAAAASNPPWLGKASAAKFLGISTRQLERRSLDGYVTKKFLERHPNERGQSVVYKLDDLIALKEGRPNRNAVVTTKKPGLPGFLAKVPLVAESSAAGRDLLFDEKGKPAPRNRLLDLSETLRVCQELGISRGDALEWHRTAKEDAKPAPHAKLAQELGISEDEAKHLQSMIVQARRVSLLSRPWLTLDEAVEFSGLTRPWLLHEAEAGQGSIAIRDMGKHTRGGRWRFFRDDLGKAE